MAKNSVMSPVVGQRDRQETPAVEVVLLTLPGVSGARLAEAVRHFFRFDRAEWNAGVRFFFFPGRQGTPVVGGLQGTAMWVCGDSHFKSSRFWHRRGGTGSGVCPARDLTGLHGIARDLGSAPHEPHGIARDLWPALHGITRGLRDLGSAALGPHGIARDLGSAPHGIARDLGSAPREPHGIARDLGPALHGTARDCTGSGVAAHEPHALSLSLSLSFSLSLPLKDCSLSLSLFLSPSQGLFCDGTCAHVCVLLCVFGLCTSFSCGAIVIRVWMPCAFVRCVLVMCAIVTC